MARKRDYRAEYARRQEIAQSKGFRSYYERRTRPAPGAAKPSGDALARLRGHRGIEDFIGYIRQDDLVMLSDLITHVTIDARGRFSKILKRVIPADRRPEREFVLRNQTRESLRRLIDRELDKGAILTVAPSLDQRRLLAKSEVEGGY